MAGVEKTPENTPTKKIYFLSPSSANICILCNEEITNPSYKKRLWTDNGEKTVYCLKTEESLGETISQNRDFKIICRNCFRKIETSLKLKHNQESLRKNSLALADTTYLRTRIKRSLKSKNNTESKKKLFKSTSLENKPAGNVVSQKLTIHNGLTSNKVCMKNDREKLVRLSAEGSIEDVFNYLLNNFPEITVALNKHVSKVAKDEANSVCKDENSKFRLGNIDDLSERSYNELLDEFQTKAPFLNNVLTSMAIGPKAHKNKLKTPQSLIPAIMNSVNTLLMCRNQNMNFCATLNSIIFKRGRANKMCMKRMKKLNICLAHKTVLKKLTLLGSNILLPVMQWSEATQLETCAVLNEINSLSEKPGNEVEVVTDELVKLNVSILDESFFDIKGKNPITNNKIDDTINSNDSDSINDSINEELLSNNDLQDMESLLDMEAELDFCLEEASIKGDFKDPTIPVESITYSSKFMVIGDNLDIRTKRRHMTKERSNVDMHLFHTIAVKNRVMIPNELIGIPANKIKSPVDIDLMKYFPNQEDESHLRDEFKALLSRDLVEYFNDLQWAKNIFPRHIQHQFTNKAIMKSEIKPLGITNHNEATNEGIIGIMRGIHPILPGHNTANVTRSFFVGDLLTVERAQNAQDDVQDADSPSKCLEGIVPGLADFHTYGNFMEVVWHILYDVRSGGDVGTLYQARNFLNSRNVPKEPMKDVNACEDLIVKFAESLSVTAFRIFCANNGDMYKKMIEKHDKEAYVNMINYIVHEHMLPSLPEFMTSLDSKYSCLYCSKKYKRKNSLTKHVKKFHKNKASFKMKDTTKDAVLNYSKNAFMLSYILKDFIDARKHGDGERIIRLYKYLMLFFKTDSRTKYAYQSLHLLAQINNLLPPALAYELKWNRSVNNAGRIDSNVELDRELEHRNKYAKLELKILQGKINDDTIKRVGCTYQKNEDIVKHFDKITETVSPSGRHSARDHKKDVLELADQYGNAEILDYKPGRYHSQFPDFPSNYLIKLNFTEYRDWMLSRIYKMSKLNIYKNPYMYT